MGILTEGINEVIATTQGNAAPMGIIFRNGTYRMACYAGSHTAENIARDRWVVANIVQDPVLYVKTAFEDLPMGSYCEEVVRGIPMSRLLRAEAWIAFSAIIEHRNTESMAVRLTLLCENIVSCRPHPVNRGFAGIIEATVHATRYRLNKSPDLKRLIDHHAAIVRKCGGPRELEALALLESYLKE